MAYKVTLLRKNMITIMQTGDVAQWSHKTAKRIESVARASAPKATGRLAASHVTLPGAGSNGMMKRWRITAMAYYSGFRHQGTGIYGPLHRPIVYRKPSGPVGRTAKGRPIYIRSQKGTKSYPWLRLAAESVGRSI